jgi:hypothetical protein
MKLTTMILLVFTLVMTTHSLSQEHDAVVTEIKSEVPALSQFHNVIYPLWHTAWPDKNVHMMVELLPEIKKLAAPVIEAKLPGILREKQSVWEKGIAELKMILADYTSATAPLDSIQLLSAAERLHMQYERLVRIIRPALKELDAFHSVLYMLYHYYMPEWNLEKVKTSVTELQEKMKSLDAATLPERLKKKTDAYVLARKELDVSVQVLISVMEKGDKATITEKINVMHSKYEALDKVFN